MVTKKGIQAVRSALAVCLSVYFWDQYWERASETLSDAHLFLKWIILPTAVAWFVSGALIWAGLHLYKKLTERDAASKND